MCIRDSLQTVFYEVHGFYRIHVGKVLAENPHAVQCLLVLQQVVAAGAGAVSDTHLDVYKRQPLWI